MRPRLQAVAAGVALALLVGGDSAPDDGGALWALVVAGSAGWANYRHQADALHAVAMLQARGVPPGRTILMIADDLPSHPANPAPGTVINSPAGRDLRGGVAVDYAGTDVNADALYAVLAGDAAAAAAATSPAASRRVLDSLAGSDRLLFFFSDHGGAGVLGMPAGPPLYGDHLVNALRSVRGAADVVAVVEACEAGSSFEGLSAFPPPLPGEEEREGRPRVWALTASAAGEPSWATFCPSGDEHGSSVPDKYATCLGDLFAVAWLADAEGLAGLGGHSDGGDHHAYHHHHHAHHAHHHRHPGPSLAAQFARVRAAVGAASHVSQFGEAAWARGEPAAALEGGRPASEAAGLVPPLPRPSPVFGAAAAVRSVPQWEADGLGSGGGGGGGGTTVSSAAAALGAALGDGTIPLAGSHAPRPAPSQGIGGLARPPPPPPPAANNIDYPCLRRLADAWAAAGCGGGLAGTKAGAAAAAAGGPAAATPAAAFTAVAAAPLTTDQSGLRHAGLLAAACASGADEGAVGAVLARACGGGGGGAVVAA